MSSPSTTSAPAPTEEELRIASNVARIAYSFGNRSGMPEIAQAFELEASRNTYFRGSRSMKRFNASDLEAMNLSITKSMIDLLAQEEDREDTSASLAEAVDQIMTELESNGGGTMAGPGSIPVLDPMDLGVGVFGSTTASQPASPGTTPGINHASLVSPPVFLGTSGGGAGLPSPVIYTGPKAAASLFIDKDGRNWTSSDRNGFKDRLDKNIHLIRILDEEHRITLLGEEMRLNPDSYTRELMNRAEEFRLGRPFHKCWEGLCKFESVQATRLCQPSNKDKFSAFIKFDWPWQEVHTLSLATFLPVEAVFTPSSKVPSSSGLRCIRTALQYFAEALTCYLGGDGYDNAVSALCAKMTDQSLQVVPVSYVFHLINYQISCVFRNYVTGTSPLNWLCTDRTMVGAPAFLRELEYGLGKAMDGLPTAGFRNDMEINHFLAVVHDKIMWTGTGSKKALEDDDDSPKPKRAKRSKKGKGQEKPIKEKPTSGTAGNEAKKALLCPFFAATTLKITKKDGDLIKCIRKDCKLSHLKSFNSVSKADLLAAANGKLHGDSLLSYQKAVEALPSSSIKP